MKVPLRRRRFLSLAARGIEALSGGIAALYAGRLFQGRLSASRVAPAGQSPLRPPGALSESEFLASCTRCFLCGEVCPVDCIEFPGRIEGAQPPVNRAPGAMLRHEMQLPVWEAGGTPYILPWKRACILCMECGQACPTGALQPIADDRGTVKQRVRMGVASIDRKICLPWTRTSWCGACLTACPYRQQAITVDHQGRPTVHPEHCVGCGLCVEVCPIRYKAIMVTPAFRPDRGEVRPE